MTLGFQTKWANGKPTYFVNKIWTSIIREHLFTDVTKLIDWQHKYLNDCIDKGLYYKDVNHFYAKIHTIREDKKDRWKPGNKIHFVVGNGTKERFQFAPVLECVLIQQFEIKYFDSYVMEGQNYLITVDGRPLSDFEILVLAYNDGFDSLTDFLNYFSKDFKGKIIHWTDFEYFE